MEPDLFLNHLKTDLRKYKDRRYRINAQRFFKEKLDNPWMLKGPIFKNIASENWQRIKHLSRREVFSICDAILESDIEARTGFAFDFAYRCRADFKKSDFSLFERWGKTHFSNWGNVDNLCCHALGHLLFMYPELTAKTKRWTKSKNQWMRRASAVSMIVSLNEKQGLTDAFEIADLLLRDNEDLVQKGYGWMLKEASKAYRDEVYSFVLERRAVMPRTALRYAIEKLPTDMRRKAMKKD